MDIGAINKGKGKGKHKGKGKKGKFKGIKETKEKDMDNKDTTTQDKAKERASKDSKYSTKDTTVMDKEKDKETQPAKEKNTRQPATDVVNKATLQRTAEFQYTTYRKMFMKDTTMQQINGMANKPPMTTIAGQMIKHKFMQCSNHNHVHCQHPHT